MYNKRKKHIFANSVLQVCFTSSFRPDKVHKKREPRAPRDKKHFQKKEYVQSYSIFADGAAATSSISKFFGNNVRYRCEKNFLHFIFH